MVLVSFASYSADPEAPVASHPQYVYIQFLPYREHSASLTNARWLMSFRGGGGTTIDCETHTEHLNPRTVQMFFNTVYKINKGKDYPRTGHEDPDGV